MAATSGDKAQLRKLLEAGVPVQTVGQNGNSPLHCACLTQSAASIAAIKVLIEYGADPGAENDHGDTPLSVAQNKKYNKIIPLLEVAAKVIEEKEAEERKKKAAKKKGGSGSSGSSGAPSSSTHDPSKIDPTAGGTLPYRRHANPGWKPLKKDWDAIVQKRKGLTDTLSGRKIAISFSNKSPDAGFAKGLDTALKALGAEVRSIAKWPVNGWVQSCVWAADEADFVLVLHSANYDDGHYAIAERFLVKESNVPHMVFELDTPSHAEYADTPEAAVKLLTSGMVMTQKERVETNTAPSTLSPHKLTKEDKDAYAKITKVWSPKDHGDLDAMKIDLEKLADEQLAASKELERLRELERAAGLSGGGSVDVTDRGGASSEAKEVEELTRLLNSGSSPSARKPPPPRTLDRQLSIASRNTHETLDSIEREVVGMQQKCFAAESTLSGATLASELDPKLRNELAQLHGNANKLLATRIDAILTGDLVSGKDDARAKRKALIQKVEKLIETVEGQVKRFDQMRASA